MKSFRQLRYKRPDISQRVVLDRSGREIADLQLHYGHDLRTFVYFYDEKLVLGEPISGTPGNINAALRDPIVEAEPVSDEKLGYLALDALLRYESGPIPNMRDSKKSDWKTFQVSGAPSLKEFGRRSVCVMIETMRGNLRLEAWSMIPEDNSFAVRAWSNISVIHGDLGNLLRKLVAGAKSLQSAGVV